MKSLVIKLSALAIAAAASVGAHAVVSFDQNVTNNVITGSGITNGGFTVDRVATGNTLDGQSIEIGLRARERHDLASNLPSNVTGSQGYGKYNQNAGEPAGFGGVTQNRARWNFDWSINTRAGGALAGGAKVDDYRYRLGMDFDAGFGTNYQTFDLINVPCADHSFGDFSTPSTMVQSGGVEVPGNPGATPVVGGNKCSAANSVADGVAYALLIANNELVQNSWNYDFFDNLPYTFDPTANGQYSIFLEAIDQSGRVLARSNIDVIVGTGAVPEPGSLALAGLALAGLAAASRRKVR